MYIISRTRRSQQLLIQLCLFCVDNPETWNRKHTGETMCSDIDIYFLVGPWNLTALLNDNRLTLSRKALAQPTSMGSLQSMSMSEFYERGIMLK